MKQRIFFFFFWEKQKFFTIVEYEMQYQSMIWRKWLYQIKLTCILRIFFFFFFFWWEHFKDLLRAEPVAKFQPQRSNNTFHPQSYRLVHVFHLWHDFVAYYCTRHRHFIFFSRNLLHILLTTLQIIYSLFSPSYKKVISELLIYVTLLALEIKDLSGDFSPKVNEF